MRKPESQTLTETSRAKTHLADTAATNANEPADTLMTEQPESMTGGRHAFSGGRPSKRVIGDIVSAIDLSLIVIASLAAKWLYLHLYLGLPSASEKFLAMGVIGGIIAVTVFRNRGLYNFDQLSQFRGQTRRIGLGLALAALVLLALGYLLKVSADFSRGWMITWFSLTALVLLFTHFLYARKLSAWIADGIFAHNIVIYGSGDIARSLIEHLSLSGGPFHIKGVFDDLPRNETPRVVLAGGLSDLIRAGQTGQIDEIIVALPMSDGRRLASLMAELSILPVNIRLCPDMAAFELRPLGIVSYDGVAVLEVARRPLDDWGPIIKSVEDRVLGFLLLIGLLPLGLLVAAAIKLTSRGPIFFRQRRHGFNHQVITVWKFRTMHVAQDGHIVPQATRDDSRITRVGRFLRRTSLDELPQLLNVVKGEMSLVGPRPHALAHNEYYVSMVERYANRHKMKPGITGWAQINGYRGETDTPDKMRKRVEFDLYYIENWSLWLDIKILVMTPFLGMWGRNAF